MSLTVPSFHRSVLFHSTNTLNINVTLKFIMKGQMNSNIRGANTSIVMIFKLRIIKAAFTELPQEFLSFEKIT